MPIFPLESPKGTMIVHYTPQNAYNTPFHGAANYNLCRAIDESQKLLYKVFVIKATGHWSTTDRVY